MSGDADVRRTTGMMAGVNGFFGFALIAFLAAAGLHAYLGSHGQFLFPVVAAIFLGFVTPVTVIAIRHQVRLSRIKLIDLFADAFGLPKRLMKAGEPAPSEDGRVDENSMLSFEFVKGKYYVDLDLEENRDPTLADVPRFPMMLHADWMLLICATPFMAVSVFSSFLLLAPIVNISDFNNPATPFPLWPSLLTLGGAPTEVLTTGALFVAQHVNTLTIATLAFAGAYFYSVRLLLRAVAVFDLSPVTFLRCFAHVILAMLLAVVIFRVAPSAEGIASTIRETGAAFFGSDCGATAPACGPAAPQGAAAASGAAPPQTIPVANAETDAAAAAAGVSPPTDGIKALWLILAFALGFVPDAALQYAIKKSNLIFKERYGELERHTKTIPLTVLDGVDPYVAFRLEESNVFDVQNLATANPIMLHIESPFGIYQTIDWVAQAQLCTIVGPERFLALKMINIRTIFDLERAVLTDGIDDEVVRLVGATLLSDSNREKDTRYHFGLTPVAGIAGQEGAQPLTGLTDARKGVGVLAVKQLVWLMIDDLHVHRLRQVWKFIGDKLGAENRAFGRFGDEPPVA